MLDLPDVTLVMAETRDHGLARLALLDCLDGINFGEVLVFTNAPVATPSLSGFSVDGCRYIDIPDWPSKLDWCHFIWFEMPRHVRTSHMLLVQWDAGVWDTGMWRDEYLQYDFIGAPWWYQSKNVGNSGFALKSTRLARYVMDRAWDFPCDTPLEDDLLCRKYRPQLEEKGFRWAPERLAHEFAFECCRPSETSRHFGYHAMFNWPAALPHERVLERLRLAMQSENIRDSNQMKAFSQKHPQIMQEFLEQKE